ncbi:MAG: asparagine synthase (glutamine-hydrolyzing) [Asgard group archaeon]|nr:asparagine synthase (glutamine-hydrolyzing) [Asgard group archaeon]
MCGILAVIVYNKKQLDNWIKKAPMLVKKLAHRGPDAERIEPYKNIILGHRRLAIIDLSDDGIQPLSVDDGKFIIIFNGEIYNYLEIREDLKKIGETFQTDTDTEVLLKAYKHYGFEFLSKINGMFSFIILDNEKEELIVVRDRFGIKPLYYSYIDGDLIFSSEIRPIAEMKNELKPDYSTIYDLAVFTSIDHSDRTFFHDIHRFPAGHYLKIQLNENKNSLQFERYWDLIAEIKTIRKNQEFKKRKLEDHISYVKKLFTEAVNFRLRSDVKVGSCLSGGIDSSSIVSTINQMIDDETRSNFETFSMVYGDWFEKSERKFIDEVTNLTKFKPNYTTPDIKKLNATIDHFLINQEEPVTSMSSIGQYYVMELAKKHGTIVLLDGQGADEILSGYLYLRGFYLYDLFRRFKWLKLLKEMWIMRKNRTTIKYFLAQFAPKFIMKNLRKDKYQKYFRKDFLKLHKQKTPPGLVNVRQPFHKMLKNLLDIKLPHLLRWEDKTSMAFSIEARVPFLDHNLVAYILALPSEYIVNKGVTKWIFREAMENVTPESILSRQDKIGFAVPEQKWVNDQKFEMINNFQKNPHKLIQEILDMNEVNSLFEKRKETPLNASDAKLLFILANLNRWFELFFSK